MSPYSYYESKINQPRKVAKFDPDGPLPDLTVLPKRARGWLDSAACENNPFLQRSYPRIPE